VDLVVRALVLFCFLLLVMRVSGRRELSSLTAFDLLLLVIVGDLIQQGVTQNDNSVTGAMIAVATIAGLSVSRPGSRSASARPGESSRGIRSSWCRTATSSSTT
jgi:hypothetical protein